MLENGLFDMAAEVRDAKGNLVCTDVAGYGCGIHPDCSGSLSPRIVSICDKYSERAVGYSQRKEHMPPILLSILLLLAA
jgi:hypothetical protein